MTHHALPYTPVKDYPRNRAHTPAKHLATPVPAPLMATSHVVGYRAPRPVVAPLTTGRGFELGAL